MNKYLLIGNGINIQFGGKDLYSSAAIMNRLLDNIKANKYSPLIGYDLNPDEQVELLQNLSNLMNDVKAGKFDQVADGLHMLKEIERIKRTYPNSNTITSIFLEDYFLIAELSNMLYKNADGAQLNEKYREIFFRFLHQIIVDSIYNDGAINNIYKSFYPGMLTFLNRFNYIFTTNYDYNLENIMCSNEKICHIHGEFGKIAPEYDISSSYYQQNKEKCDKLIANITLDMNHIYSNTIMSWSWLDKYGELIQSDVKEKELLFKSIDGSLEILGLSPSNDEHLFFLINENPNINSVIYYYINKEDIIELQHHINKPVTFKKASKLWDSMK